MRSLHGLGFRRFAEVSVLYSAANWMSTQGFQLYALATHEALCYADRGSYGELDQLLLSRDCGIALVWGLARFLELVYSTKQEGI